jgi:hypothetical protein
VRAGCINTHWRWSNCGLHVTVTCECNIISCSCNLLALSQAMIAEMADSSIVLALRDIQCPLLIRVDSLIVPTL